MMQQATPQPFLVEQIDLMLRSRYPLLYIVAAEEPPISPLFDQVCKLTQPNRQLLTWDVTPV